MIVYISLNRHRWCIIILYLICPFKKKIGQINCFKKVIFKEKLITIFINSVTLFKFKLIQIKTVNLFNIRLLYSDG